MSASGQTWPFRDVRLESVIPPMTDIRLMGRYVREVPLADLADRHRLRKLPTAVEDLGRDGTL